MNVAAPDVAHVGTLHCPHISHVPRVCRVRKLAGEAKRRYLTAAANQLHKQLSRRAAGPSGSATRRGEDDGRRDQVSRYTSRHDSGEACHVPAPSFGSDP